MFEINFSVDNKIWGTHKIWGNCPSPKRPPWLRDYFDC